VVKQQGMGAATTTTALKDNGATGRLSIMVNNNYVASILLLAAEVMCTFSAPTSYT